MANLKPILVKYGAYIELAAYLIAFIAILIPFKKVGKEEKKSLKYYKRKDMYGSYDDFIDFTNEAKKYNDSGNASYVKFTSGVFVLIFTLLSAAVVALNTFAKSVVENLKNNNKDKAKIIDITVEVIPLALTLLSFLLTLISTGDGKFGDYIKEEGGKITLQFGFYLLLLAILVALAVRIAYLIIVKEYNKLISNKPIVQNREVKTEQTANEVVVPVN